MTMLAVLAAAAVLGAVGPTPVSPPTSSAPDVEAQWPSFRGAGARGVAAGSGPHWWNVESGAGVAWQTPIPGLSHSSPVVWGDRVFVGTAVSSEGEPLFRHGLYGDVDSVESTAEHTWRLVALDRRTGKVLWDQAAATGRPRVKRHMKSTHADPTPATDGKRVVVLFPAAGLFAYDLDGRLLWKRDLGVLDAGWFYDPSYQWEFGSSPILWRDLVIVQADIQKGSSLAAYDAATGEERWRVTREEIPSWATPTVVEADGKAVLVTNATKAIRGYDPATGKELWALRGNSEIVVPTPFAAHGFVYLTSGYRGMQPIYAVRPGSRGDITPADGAKTSPGIAWMHPTGGPYMPTPLVVGNHLFTVSNSGLVAVYDAVSGERLNRQKLPLGTAFSASPIAADGRLYLASEDGDVFVMSADPQLEVLGRHPLGEVLMATPAIVDGMLLVRGRRHLFGITGAAPPAAPAAPSAATTAAP